MTHRPGARQRAILEAMKGGARLWLESGIWYTTTEGTDRVINRLGSSCRSLMEHGYIYNDRTDHGAILGTRWRYALTEQGKEPL